MVNRCVSSRLRPTSQRTTNPRRRQPQRGQNQKRTGVSIMGLRVRTVAFSLTLCAAAMGQEPVMKPPVASQDLSKNPLLAPRSLPVPPVPDLTRLGVTGGALPLSLNDAIRRALENNNSIEISRDNVRLADTTLRSLQGVYDPIINITPQFSDL